MKAGDILARKRGERRWLALSVNLKDIRKGTNARNPGLYAFGGCWYGETASSTSFGKLTKARTRVVGHVPPGRRIPKLIRKSLA